MFLPIRTAWLIGFLIILPFQLMLSVSRLAKVHHAHGFISCDGIVKHDALCFIHNLPLPHYFCCQMQCHLTALWTIIHTTIEPELHFMYIFLYFIFLFHIEMLLQFLSSVFEFQCIFILNDRNAHLCHVWFLPLFISSLHPWELW